MTKRKLHNIEFSFNCEYIHLDKVRKFINTEATSFGFNQDDAYNISLAVDEACTNLIRHCYLFNNEKTISIEIETKSKEFIVKIKDNGSPFNPLDFPSPDMNQYLKSFKRGGLGIHIMRSIMDKISYNPSNKSERTNVLTLIKVLN